MGERDIGTVTLDVEQLRLLIRNADKSDLWLNLPGSDRDYRVALRINVLHHVTGPVFRFERIVNDRTVAISEVTADHVFDFFPRIARLLDLFERHLEQHAQED